MGSEDQVTNRVENCVKIIIPNVENVESITAENGIQFEIPPTEVGLLTKRHERSNRNRPHKEGTASDDVYGRHRANPNLIKKVNFNLN